MRRNNNHSKIALSDIHAQVEYTRKYGDVVDATPRLYRDIAFQTHFATQVPALAIANMGANSPLTGEALSSFGHSYPLLGIVGFAAGYKINKLREKKERADGDKARDIHYAVQKELYGVDLIRGKDKRLYMNSGLFSLADMQGHELGEDAVRLAHRALVAKKYDIDFITIPRFARLRSPFSKRDAKKLGSDKIGSFYALRKHGVTNPDVHERLKYCDYSSGWQLELTPDHALALAAELQKDRVGPLLSHLKNPQLTKLYAKSLNKPALEQEFTKKLRGALTRQLGTNESPSKVYRQDLGEGRTNNLYQVTPDNRIMTTERETYFENNTQRAAIQVKTIHEFFGYKTEGELLHDVAIRDQQRKSGQPPLQPELLLAASLLLMTGGGKKLIDRSLEKNLQTPYKGMWDRDWTYTRLLNSRHSNKNHHRLPIRHKLVAAVGALMLTHFGGAYANAINSSQSYDAINIAQNAQEASEATARHITNFPATIESFLHGNRKPPLPTLPDSPYVKSNRINFGEFSPLANRSVYSVTSLSGVSTEGYWNASTHDSLAINEDNASYPFVDAGIGAFTSDIGIGYGSHPHYYHNSEEEIIARFQPDIRVTQHIDNRVIPNYYTLPILRGYGIVGVRLTDEAHPERGTTAEIRKTPQGENYMLSPYVPSGEEYNWVGFEKPRLDYWLKKMPTLPTYTQKMRFPIENRWGDEIDTQVVAKRTRAALGLAEDASDLAVFNQIKNKYYSLEPFRREGIDPITLGYDSLMSRDDLTALTSRIAETYAEREALLCNLANLALILGTEATMDGVNLNLSQGYMESNGDGHLTVNESHVWATGSDGKIYDATPTNLAPGETPLETGLPANQPTPTKAPFSAEKLLIGIGTVAGVAAVSLAIDYWRQRRRAKAFESNSSLSTSEPKKPEKESSTPKRTLSDPYITQAINEINRITYSNGNPSSVTRDKTVQTLIQDDPLSTNLINSIPSPRTLRRIAKENGIDYDNIAPETQLAIEKLYRNRHSIASYLQDDKS